MSQEEGQSRQERRRNEKLHAEQRMEIAKGFRDRAEMVRDFLTLYGMTLPAGFGMVDVVQQFITDIETVTNDYNCDFPAAIAGEKSDNDTSKGYVLHRPPDQSNGDGDE